MALWSDRAAPLPQLSPEPISPPLLPAGDADDVTLSAPWDTLVPRVAWPEPRLAKNLRYEANNEAIRGARRDDGTFTLTGAEVAARWRALAPRTAGIFALRDALFSQQDHPIDGAPYAVMLPPSWVTVATGEALAGRSLRGPFCAPLDDDAAWMAPRTLEDAFGVFPPSERLFEASRGADALRAQNARRTLLQLCADVHALAEAAPRGGAAVAEAGAERIAASDARYFGAARARIIPIGVEHPNPHEIADEGKGLEVAGRALPAAAVSLARAAIYRRRLRDGDLAVERYDLGVPADRARALDVLATLVPAGEGGHTVWLWCNGGLDARGIGGRPPDAHVPGFLAALRRDRRIDAARVRLFGKPHVDLRAESDPRAALEAHASRLGALGLPVSINWRAPALWRALALP